MVKSMTGFGRSKQLINGREIAVEIKAVNHRYFEFTARLPRNLAFLEDSLKQIVQAQTSRGKTEIAVTVQAAEGIKAKVTLSEELASSYLGALRDFGTKNSVADDITLSTLARFGDIFTLTKLDDDEESIGNDVKAVTEEALKNFVAMRIVEGKRLTDDVLMRLDTIDTLVKKVEEKSPETVAAYRAKLTARIEEVLADRQVDEQRIVTEAAIFADKIAVDEETVRLHSHLSQLRSILSGGNAVGRKLDFLVQEVNREVNTIGSKAQNMEITMAVVEMKSEVEKIREQIQNME